MNKTISEKKADPVPSKKLLMIVVILLSAATCGITSAKAAAAEGWEAPVLLSDGTLMKAPWYIMVDGKKAALVDSRETAEQVIQNIVTSCGHEGAEVLDVELKEETTTKRMDLELGDDPPDVMTAAEAEEKLLGTEKEESILTVVTTEERKEEEDIDIPEEYQPVKSLSVGEIKVASEGSPGTKEITKKVTKENGNPVSETILEESVVEEPEEKVILAGTNDLAQNNGPIATQHIVENIISMAELAMAAGIRPIICSVLPAGKYPWRTEIESVPEKIRDLNARLHR